MLKQKKAKHDLSRHIYTAVLKNTNEDGPAVICSLFGANKFGITNNQIGGENGFNGADVQILESSHAMIRAEALVNPFMITGFRYKVDTFDQFLEMVKISKNYSSGTIAIRFFNPLKFRSIDQRQSLQVDCPDYYLEVNSYTELEVSVLPKQTVIIMFEVQIFNQIEKYQFIKKNIAIFTKLCKAYFPVKPQVNKSTKDFFFDKTYTAVLENTNESGDPVICTIFGAEEFGNSENQNNQGAVVRILESSHAQVRSQSSYSPFWVKRIRYFVSNRKQLALKGEIINKDSDGNPVISEFKPLNYITASQEQFDQIDCPGFEFTVDHQTKFEIPVTAGCKVVVLMEIGARFNPQKSIKPSIKSSWIDKIKNIFKKNN